MAIKAISKPLLNTLFALVFFLCSCGKQSHWAFDQIRSKKQEHSSTKLTYHARDPIHGIDIEFLIQKISPITASQLNPETAVENDKLTQSFEQELIRTAELFTIYKSTTDIATTSDSKSCITLPFRTTDSRLNAYLNVHSIAVPPYRNNPQAALVTLQIAEEKHSVEVYRLEGGQRFLLPKEMTDTLILALQANLQVTISLGSYRSTIVQEDFSSKFDQFQHPFPIQNPFRLPL